MGYIPHVGDRVLVTFQGGQDIGIVLRSDSKAIAVEHPDGTLSMIAGFKDPCFKVEPAPTRYV